MLQVETTAAGTDNSLTTLVDLVEQAQAEKGDRARIADRIAQPLVPGVMILAVLVGVTGSLLGDPETWITRALVVLVAVRAVWGYRSAPGLGWARILGQSRRHRVRHSWSGPKCPMLGREQVELSWSACSFVLLSCNASLNISIH